MSESKYKERQWTANKEAYYREFSSGTAVVITSTTAASVGVDGIPEPIAAAPRKLSPAEAEMRGELCDHDKIIHVTIRYSDVFAPSPLPPCP